MCQPGAVQAEPDDPVAPDAPDLESSVGIGRPGTLAAQPGRVPVVRRRLVILELAGGNEGTGVDSGVDGEDPIGPDGHPGDGPALRVDHPAADRDVVADELERCLAALQQ